ncbi:MAG: PRC-barrel domain-containing protein [Candidatus Magasanikbacteria bacterium]
MRLNFKQLKGLEVETKNGIFLGHIYDIVVDIESNLLVQIVVKKMTSPNKKYLINTSQIVQVKVDKIIVEDNMSVEKKIDLNQNKIPTGDIISA